MQLSDGGLTVIAHFTTPYTKDISTAEFILESKISVTSSRFRRVDNVVLGLLACCKSSDRRNALTSLNSALDSQ
jgi:hypothetical protein